jgi:hypothetical protein
MYYPRIFLDKLRKSTKNLSQDNRSPGPDVKLGSPEYEAGVLTTLPRLSGSLPLVRTILPSNWLYTSPEEERDLILTFITYYS